MSQLTAIHMEALQYTIPATAVKPLGDDDSAFVRDFEQVLKANVYENRLGLTLLAHDFNLKGSEVVYETTDEQARISTMRVLSNIMDNANAVVTNWSFNGGETKMGRCAGWCHFNNGHKHHHTIC